MMNQITRGYLLVWLREEFLFDDKMNEEEKEMEDEGGGKSNNFLDTFSTY